MSSYQRSDVLKKVVLENLRDRIADAVASLKSYEVPGFCNRLGLQDGVSDTDLEEAFRSKRVYTKARLGGRTAEELIKIGGRVLLELDADPLEELLSELTTPAAHRVSDLVRMDILKGLNSLEKLFGEKSIIDSLAEIFGESKIKDDVRGYLKLNSLEGKIEQWYIKNPDWSHETLLIECGALTCSQKRFFQLIHQIVDPAVRRGAEQAELAAKIDISLKRDGFSLKPVESRSGYPVYGIRRSTTGVGGAMKNLIFASSGEKPEIILRDALSNDVEIVKHADKVLIFDHPLPEGGLLLYTDLVDWWADLSGEKDARSGLYKRLFQSVKMSRSPGEIAVFRTYYGRYGALLGDKLPALIPQVYLHYDPYSKRARGKEVFLPRQRMDFLLLLENGNRIVIEIDGQHHYADQDPDNSRRYIASPRRYAEMAREDRRLRLAGYEVYRFGGAEFAGVDMTLGKVDPDSETVVADLIDQIFKRQGIL